MNNFDDLYEVHCYIDQLINNEDGKYDALGGAWFVVPKAWLEDRIKEAGFKDMDEFYNSYTYDDTDGWINKAVEDGVLEGAGCGISPYELAYYRKEDSPS